MVKQAQSTSNKTSAGAITKGKSATKKTNSETQRAPSTNIAEERQRTIAESAYYLAEQRGFQGDMALDDWLRAESEVDTRLNTSG